MESFCGVLPEDGLFRDFASNLDSDLPIRKDLVLQLVQEKDYRLSKEDRNLFLTIYLRLFRLCVATLKSQLQSDEESSATKALKSYVQYTSLEVQHDLLKLLDNSSEAEDRVAYLLLLGFAARLLATNEKENREVYGIYQTAWDVAKSSLKIENPFHTAAYQSFRVQLKSGLEPQCINQ